MVDHGKPEIFNTDQGSQFTSVAFTGVLKREGANISMDGQVRALDNVFVERLWRNVKYEDVYLNGYATMGGLHAGLTQYFAYYDGERPHQRLNYQTPDVVYKNGKGGGAMIVDKYGSVPERTTPEPGSGPDTGDAERHRAQPRIPPCPEQNSMAATLAAGYD